MIEVLKQALGALDRNWDGCVNSQEGEAIASLIQAIAELESQEPVAWMHTKIDGVAVPHRPADLDKHPERWEALYKTPPPCPTCEALARTVMLDQTSHDTTPPQRTGQEPFYESTAIVHIKDGCLVGSHRDKNIPFPDGQYGLWPIATPPQRQWVGLTEDQIDDIWNRYCDEMGEASINDAYDIARAIEAELKDKNT